MASSVLLLVTAVCLLAGSAFGHDGLSNKKHFRCRKEGRYEDPNDCGSYIDCIPDREGGLAHRHGSCWGRAYDSTIKRCVEPKKVKGCTPREGKALASDPSLAYICEDGLREFVCSDCKTLVNCVNGTAYPEKCDSGDFCANKPTDFGGGVCYPNEPEECTCEKPNSFKMDFYDEGHFLFCEDEDSDPVTYQCPEDHYFDPVVSQCRNYEGLPDCEKIGVFADARNCTTYYTCIFTTTGWVQKPFSCNNETDTGLMFNEGTGRCEDPCEWDDGEFTCEYEGRYPDPLSCKRYYECVLNPSGEGFRQILHECPEGYEWDRTARNDYGHCVLEGTSKEPCAPHKPEKCIIPQGQCSNNQDPAPPVPQPIENLLI